MPGPRFRRGRHQLPARHPAGRLRRTDRPAGAGLPAVLRRLRLRGGKGIA